MATRTKIQARKLRHRRIRRNISGTASRPRLSVYRSLKHIYVQAIDDTTGRTLASASTLSQELKGKLPRDPQEQAIAIGRAIAEKLRAAGIEEAVFDRGGYRYHGRIKCVADGARAAGLRL